MLKSGGSWPLRHSANPPCAWPSARISESANARIRLAYVRIRRALGSRFLPFVRLEAQGTRRIHHFCKDTDDWAAMT